MVVIRKDDEARCVSEAVVLVASTKILELLIELVSEPWLEAVTVL
jgi:hypothetical protein